MLPKVGDLFLEYLSQSFLDILKFVLLFVSDGHNPIGPVPVHVRSAKGETIMHQSRIYHESSIESVQQIVQVAQMPKAAAHPVSVDREKRNSKIARLNDEIADSRFSRSVKEHL